MNKLRDAIAQNNIVSAILFVNTIATIFTVFNPKMVDKLFELYLGTTVGLYGYIQQQSATPSRSNIESSGKGSSDDSESSSH
jgi:hypothetical protein